MNINHDIREKALDLVKKNPGLTLEEIEELLTYLQNKKEELLESRRLNNEGNEGYEGYGVLIKK